MTIPVILNSLLLPCGKVLWLYTSYNRLLNAAAQENKVSRGASGLAAQERAGALLQQQGGVTGRLLVARLGWPAAIPGVSQRHLARGGA
jgi:hypothetical protein